MNTSRNWIRLSVAAYCAVTLVSCAKDKEPAVASDQAVMASSAFFPGELAHPMHARGVILGSGSTSDGGTIAGPGTGSGHDTGTIPAGGSTGSTGTTGGKPGSTGTTTGGSTGSTGT